MTFREARAMVRRYYDLSNPSEEDRFLCAEALQFLIYRTKDPEYMVALGSIHYEKREYDLALKYYGMAAEAGDLDAIVGLGYIWYYGRTGTRDYEKAYHYYSLGCDMGSVVAAYKVADMYKNGYYVEQDAAKYREIIEDLYRQMADDPFPDGPVPEIFTRLAKIRAEEGRTEEALALYDRARKALSMRIQDHLFFGDVNIMKWLIGDVYRMRPFDRDDFDLYDLFYVLSRPALVRFTFEGEPHEAEAAVEDGALVFRLDDRWYRTIEDFFMKAELDGEHITARINELLDFEVVSGWS